MNALKGEILLELFDIKAVRFGSFTLKSGSHSPVYFDLRLMVSYPKLIKKIAKALWPLIKGLKFDLICGVPYGAIPLATCISLDHEIPMILQRKERKAHGTKKQIEGAFSAGQSCLLIEDVITSGASLMESLAALHEEQLEVNEIAVLLDREQGGKKILESKNIKVHALFTISELLQILSEHHKISSEISKEVLQFVQSSQVAQNDNRS